MSKKYKPYTARIVMSGPTGAGKTSLLAAMYPKLETHFPGNAHKLIPEENTRKVLDILREKLKKLGTGGIKIKDKEITGTLQAQEFNFDLCHNGSKDAIDMSLQIFDIPGEYCTADSGAKARAYLDGSDISFWCVDSVALMERNGEFNESSNAPDEMADCFLASNLKPGHTVCIVLMRTETYQQDEENNKLIKTLKDKYAATVTRLRIHPNIKNIFICAIKTTGNLRFNSYDGSDPVFIRARSDAGYSPKFCELPVLVAVNYSLEFAKNNAREEIKRIIWWQRLLKPSEYKRKLNMMERLVERFEQVHDIILQKLGENAMQIQKW